MKYLGSCHCGNVRFEVEGDLNGATACNCSICLRKGSLLWFVPREQLRVLSAAENIATYTFNRQVVQHRFCAVCGIHPYGEGADPTGKPMAAINIRCLEGIDLEKVPVRALRWTIVVTLRGKAGCAETSELFSTSNRRLAKLRLRQPLCSSCEKSAALTRLRKPTRRLSLRPLMTLPGSRADFWLHSNQRPHRRIDRKRLPK